MYAVVPQIVVPLEGTFTALLHIVFSSRVVGSTDSRNEEQIASSEAMFVGVGSNVVGPVVVGRLVGEIVVVGRVAKDTGVTLVVGLIVVG